MRTHAAEAQHRLGRDAWQAHGEAPHSCPQRSLPSASDAPGAAGAKKSSLRRAACARRRSSSCTSSVCSLSPLPLPPAPPPSASLPSLPLRARHLLSCDLLANRLPQDLRLWEAVAGRATGRARQQAAPLTAACMIVMVECCRFPMQWLCRAMVLPGFALAVHLAACHHCLALPCKFTDCVDLIAIIHCKPSLITVGRTAVGTRRLPPLCWSFAPVMHLATTLRCSAAARAAPLWAAVRSRSLAAAAAAAESSPSSSSGSDAASGTRVALVQGSSGLGLEFVRQLVERPNTRVVATCRSPAAAEQLQALQQRNAGRLHIVQLDSTDESSIARAAEQARRRGSRAAVAAPVLLLRVLWNVPLGRSWAMR